MVKASADIVELCNLFTVRWTEAFSSNDNTVISGPGAYVLLLAVLAGAGGTARQELENGLLAEKTDAPEHLQALHEIMSRVAGMRLASGLFARPEFGLKSGYAQRLHPVTARRFPAMKDEMDKWVATHTDGHIENFPVELEEIANVFWASIIHCKAAWQRCFEDADGYWHTGSTRANWLSRIDTDMQDAALLGIGNDQFSRLTCPTKGGFDVHLLAGDLDTPPSLVLSAGIRALTEPDMVTPGPDLQKDQQAGVMRWKRMHTKSPDERMHISLPGFDINCDRDLGLDCRRIPGWENLLPGPGILADISDKPLAALELLQVARATFDSTGFEASAISVAMDWLDGGVSPPVKNRVLDFSFDRPYGFLVVDRVSNLVVFAGWHGRF